MSEHEQAKRDAEYAAYLRRSAERLKRADLSWVDSLGRRWNKVSDILTDKDLQNPDPQQWQRRRRKHIEKRNEE
jgi:hypothetical protein